MPLFLDQFMFVVLPYIAMLVFLLGTIMRYRKAPYSYSSLSSQFLENRRHFWALVPFHFGIIAVLTGHVVAFLLPHQILQWNSRPLRLHILETTALIFGLMTAVGIIASMVRRITFSKVREVTNRFDWIVLAMLLLQVLSGIYVAIFNPWGSSWFSAAVAPYLSSLVRFVRTSYSCRRCLTL
jgi:nitrate reductase gamma subunit